MANTANVTILPLEPAHVTSIPKGVDVPLRAQLTSIAGLALPAGAYKLGIAVKDVTSLGLHILDEDVSLRNAPARIWSCRSRLTTRSSMASRPSSAPNSAIAGQRIP